MAVCEWYWKVCQQDGRVSRWQTLRDMGKKQGVYTEPHRLGSTDFLRDFCCDLTSYLQLQSSSSPSALCWYVHLISIIELTKMVEADNFIIICDLSPKAEILWSSFSIEDCLGYTTQEMMGISGYDLTLKEDFSQIRIAHQESMQNDMLVSQLFLPVRRKDGRLVNCSAVLSICYECLVACIAALPTDGDYCRFLALT